MENRMNEKQLMFKENVDAISKFIDRMNNDKFTLGYMHYWLSNLLCDIPVKKREIILSLFNDEETPNS